MASAIRLAARAGLPADQSFASQRILATLLIKGRSTIPQLASHTSINLRLLRHGLGVLVQQNLLFHHTDADNGATHYEANPDACYNLVRSGKILDVIETNYGAPEREVVQILMLLGHARIADLVHAFSSRGGTKTNGVNGSHVDEPEGVASPMHLHKTLARLVQAEIVEPVRPESFRKPADIYQEIIDEVTKAAPGEKSTKKKDQQSQEIEEQYRQYQERAKMLKRQLDQDHGPTGKRRKLENGAGSHQDDQRRIEVNPNVVVKVNYERCSVELRNQRLAEYAADTFGEVTGQIYRTALELLTSKIPRCRQDPKAGTEMSGVTHTTTTAEIFEYLDSDVRAQSGIGKAGRDKIDFRSAEKIQAEPPGSDTESDEDEVAPPPRSGSRNAAESDDDDSEESEEDEAMTGAPVPAKANGRHSKVKFEDEETPTTSRIDQMRQHLLLLAEGKTRFLRHCGSQGRGQWTVDFSQLMDKLREGEMDAVIGESHGRHGLRLTRILREKGKLDEKTLPLAALMKKSDVQGKMLAMQMAGIVDVQEVPKDNSRLANRTLFFWFFDRERTEAQMLDDLYKAMLRCLQTLDVERHRNRNVLSFVERKDVKGREEEVMTAEHYNEYNKHLEVQEKLLAQVSRLDEMVAVLRDY
ncbi:RNA polymerase III subunit RPC82 domain-containing protein [Sarocladium implicatum]|nr:RNA polymerase III subunit RPC82 domain-containing protein [Sarocladium implicatum]